MKIAVCISGLPRTGLDAAPFILNHFASTEHTVDYFCHVWDSDMFKSNASRQPTTYKKVPHEKLMEIISKFNPIAYHIDELTILDQWSGIYKRDHGLPNQWSHLFYSCMMANHLKRQHEMKHEFKYDLVVKIRYDSVFNPQKKFYPPKLHPLKLYTTHLEVFPYEFSRVNFSDVIFCGTSEAMDIACEYFRFLSFHTTTLSDHLVGPGVGLYKYLIERNVTPAVGMDYEIILRPEALNDLTWENIVNVHKGFYI